MTVPPFSGHEYRHEWFVVGVPLEPRWRRRAGLEWWRLSGRLTHPIVWQIGSTRRGQIHLRHKSRATIGPPKREAQRGCPQPVSDHPAERGETAGPMPPPPQRLSPTPVSDAMTVDRLRRLASVSAQLRAEVGARRLPPFQEISRPSAPCPFAHPAVPMKPQTSSLRSDRPSPVDTTRVCRP
jgi:hypothetical protein